MTPAEFIKWRTSLGWSRTAAAQALGVSKRAVAFWETGDRSISPPIKLACLWLSHVHRT